MPFVAKNALETKTASNVGDKLTQAGQSMDCGFEFFSLLRGTHADINVEYENYEQLKRLRQGYLVHIMDQALCERAIVAKNDTEL